MPKFKVEEIPKKKKTPNILPKHEEPKEAIEIVSEGVILEASKTVYKKKYKCPYCNERHDREKLVIHVEDEHEDLVPDGYSPTRVVFNVVNKKTTGKCVICGKETKWNEKNGKYDRYDSDKCIQVYRKTRDERMMKARGKLYVTDDIEFQKKMLANRKISGTYKFTDGGERTYTGSYEKNLLEFLDTVMGFTSDEILTPGRTVYYEYEGQPHAWILDVTILPFNLEIDAKDGGSNPNKREMPEYRAKQLAKEKAIEEQKEFNYLRLTDNDFSQLLYALSTLKSMMIDDNKNTEVFINEYMAMGGVSPVVNNSEKGDVEKPVKFIVPAMVQNSFVEPLYARDEFLEKMYRIIDGKLVLTNRSEVKKQFDIPVKLIKSSNADKESLETIEDMIKNESYVDHDIMFKLLTGNHLLDGDQYILDKSLSIELEGFYKASIKNSIIESTIMNTFNKVKITYPLNESTDLLSGYNNLRIEKDVVGYYAINMVTNQRSVSYPDLYDIPDDVLTVLNEE